MQTTKEKYAKCNQMLKKSKKKFENKCKILKKFSVILYTKRMESFVDHIEKGKLERWFSDSKASLSY